MPVPPRWCHGLRNPRSLAEQIDGKSFTVNLFMIATTSDYLTENLIYFLNFEQQLAFFNNEWQFISMIVPNLSKTLLELFPEQLLANLFQSVDAKPAS